MTLFIGTSVIGGRDTRVEYIHAAVIGANQSSYSFTSVPFGTPLARRHIIIGFQAAVVGLDNNQPDACTIGGNTAVLAATISAVALAWTQIWIAPQTTLTSGTVTVSRSGGNMTHGLMIGWSAHDLVSGTVSSSVVGAFANPSTGNLSCQAGGIAVGLATTLSAGGWTWTGLNKDVEGTGTGTAASVRYSGASLSKTASGALAISSEQAASHNFLAASWR